MFRILLKLPSSLMALCCFFFCETAIAASPDNVVLLHGMGRTSMSMLLLKGRLEKQGFRVVSETYDSTGAGTDDHVEWLDAILAGCCNEAEVKTHFVTHSLGGIVVRKYLKERTLSNLGRVVMLSPPNQGSELADYMKDWALFELSTGPSGQELGTQTESTPNQLGPVDFDLGVITGDASFNPVTSLLIIPGPDDGKVSVDRARVVGMTDFIVVNHTHTFIMNSSRVAREVGSFLTSGAFLHEESDELTQEGTN